MIGDLAAVMDRRLFLNLIALAALPGAALASGGEKKKSGGGSSRPCWNAPSRGN